MKVAVIGSRHCDGLQLADLIQYIPRNCTQIISGGAQGIDQMAQSAARELGLDLIQILPDYQQYGKAAPLKRNALIVEEADLVLAFWDYRSRGTANTIVECINRHVPVKVIPIAEAAHSHGDTR